MSKKAIIVINTDFMEDIINDPETFAITLRQNINSSLNRGGEFGILHASTIDGDATWEYVISPNRVVRGRTKP